MSRVIHLFGRWVSPPPAIMADSIFLVLAAMIVAKMVGGRAPLVQHLTAVLISSAPIALLRGTYILDMSPVMPVTFAVAISLFARIIAVTGFVWIALLLVKGPPWRTNFPNGAQSAYYFSASWH